MLEKILREEIESSLGHINRIVEDAVDPFESSLMLAHAISNIGNLLEKYVYEIGEDKIKNNEDVKNFINKVKEHINYGLTEINKLL